jgi:hypothetical protein
MFSSLELRKVTNGFLVTVNNDDETEEYVFDSLRKTIKFVKELSDASPKKKQPAAEEK